VVKQLNHTIRCALAGLMQGKFWLVQQVGHNGGPRTGQLPLLDWSIAGSSLSQIGESLVTSFFRDTARGKQFCRHDKRGGL